jgi:hypothetical protein
VAGPFALQVFAEAHIEHPVQFIFDTRALADGAGSAAPRPA